jgi:hypothetical protein
MIRGTRFEGFGISASFCIIVSFLPGRALAQDNYEIQVYSYDTVAPRFFSN